MTAWEPCSPNLCDVKLEREGAPPIWVGSSGLKPIDGLGSLPSRQAAIEANRVETLQSLRAIRAGLVDEIRRGVAWPGLEHGKVLLGRAIDGAIRDNEP